MQIPIAFDLPNHPMTELLDLRSQVNREFSRFSRTLSRGRMHISLTNDQVVCSLDLHTQSGQKVTISETAKTLKQAFRVAVQAAQQRLRAIELDSAKQARSLRRASGGSFGGTQLLS